jgi:DNA processing protein
MNTAERRARAALWSVRGVGPSTIEQIEQRFGPLGELLERPVSIWAPSIDWSQPETRERIAAVGTLAERADWLDMRCLRDGVRLLFPGDAAFPERLVDIPKPPIVLAVRGPVCDAPSRRRIAIVGTRFISDDQCQRVMDLASEAASAGLCVVSGAADGTDRSAHLGTLSAKGETWSFMGSALDQLDEAQLLLGLRILEGGGSLLSDYPPGYRASRSTFVQRNRLISGASDAVLVFRAGETSGALHTADAALLQGRTLLCSPGAPWDGSCKGTNELLRSGKARPCLDAGDLLEAVGLKGTITPATRAPLDLAGLTESAKTVLDQLSKGSADFEELQVRFPAFTSGALSAALTELEIFGAVLHKGGRRYEKR